MKNDGRVSMGCVLAALSALGACAGTQEGSAGSAAAAQGNSKSEPQAHVAPQAPSQAAPQASPAAPHAEAQAAAHAKPDAAASPASSHDPIPALSSAKFDAAKPAELEVLRVPTGHLLVKPHVNGIETGWFIFDTGAGIGVISTSHLAKFDLAPVGDIASQGVGGDEQNKIYRASSVVLGPMTLRDHTFMSTDLSFLQVHLGEEIAGVIGFGLLSQCVAEIDPVEERIALHDPATYTLTGCEWMPVDLADRVPALKARFEDHEGVFHIDTGANSGVSFSAGAVAKWKLLEGRDVQDAKLGGVGGYISAKRGKLAWLDLGGLRQDNVEATFPLEAKGALGGDNIDGSLGAQVLRPYVLVTDYSHQRVALRPRQ